jgi:hypothetical protein
MKNYLEDLWQKKATKLHQALDEIREDDATSSMNKRFRENQEMSDLKITEPNGDFSMTSTAKTSETIGPLQRDGYSFLEKKNNDEFESYRVTRRVNKG